MSKRYVAFRSAYHARAISCLGYYACQECISSEQQHHYMYLLLPSWCLLDPEYSIRSIGGQRTLYQNLSSYQAYMFCHSNRSRIRNHCPKVLVSTACMFLLSTLLFLRHTPIWLFLRHQYHCLHMARGNEINIHSSCLFVKSHSGINPRFRLFARNISTVIGHERSREYSNPIIGSCAELPASVSLRSDITLID